MSFFPLHRLRLNQPSGDGIDWFNSINKNLIASIGLGTLYDAAASKSLLGPHTGTKVVGAGRGFGATDGAGTTDKILTNVSGNHGPRTYFVVAKLNGWGGSGLGRFIEGTIATQEVFYVNNSYGLIYYRTFSGGPRTAHINSAGAVSALFGKVASYSISFDSSNPANRPELYVNGVRYAFNSQDSIPTGTANATGALYIGNRASDSARCCDGTIYSVDVFDRMFSEFEHKALAASKEQMYL